MIYDEMKNHDEIYEPKFFKITEWLSVSSSYGCNQCHTFNRRVINVHIVDSNWAGCEFVHNYLTNIRKIVECKELTYCIDVWDNSGEKITITQIQKIVINDNDIICAFDDCINQDSVKTFRLLLKVSIPISFDCIKNNKEMRVHCYAGRSRSISVCLGLLLLHNIPLIEAQNMILKVRPVAYFDIWGQIAVSLVDEINILNSE